MVNQGGPSLGSGVAARLATLSLTDAGRPRRTVFVDQAIRGALMLDLATVGRITLRDDEVEIDTTPVGYGPADLLLAEVATIPDRTLDEWILRGTPVLSTMIRELVATSRWKRRRAGLGWAYTCLEPTWLPTPESSMWPGAAGTLNPPPDQVGRPSESGGWSGESGGSTRESGGLSVEGGLVRERSGLVREPNGWPSEPDGWSSESTAQVNPAQIAENLARKVNLRRDLKPYDLDPNSPTGWLEASILELLTETLAAAPGSLLTFGAGI